MQKKNCLFSFTFLSNILTGAIFLMAVFLLDTAISQPNNSDMRLNAENLCRAPFISAVNLQQNMQNIMQNAEKDIVFIENLGQIRDSKGNKRPDILFLTRSQGVDMYITSSGLTYVFRKSEGDIKNKPEEGRSNYYRLDMEFVGMNKNFKIKKELAVEQQFNYYTPEYTNGISPKAYKKVIVENIYNGIDLVYYEKEGKMKYDFIVKAGADFRKIKMKYKGAGNIYIDKYGSVIATTHMGEIREEKPYIYSRNTGMKIESSYEINDEVILFRISEYNRREDLIIDPYRMWATYYGGDLYEEAYNICTDNSNNLYITGRTFSMNLPIQTFPGAYNQTTYGGGEYDIFILKFNSSGARLWATYYGGDSANEYGNSICTDNSGNLYITGGTSDINFPIQTLQGAYNQTNYGGGFEDAFILKFSSSGVRLWATYYGGNGFDYGKSICTDNSGNLYVTGDAGTADFPTQILQGAYNQTFNAGTEVFILKFNSSGTRLWATFYGGSNSDFSQYIYTDSSNNLYITGRTHAPDFPTKILPGAYNQDTMHGVTDVFILKFNSSGARLWGTYYGGSNNEAGKSICTDNSGNLFITGFTKSTNFPTQTLIGAYNQTSYGGGNYDAFILKFNSSGARLWATYYGGSDHDYGYSLCTDSSGSLFVTGGTTGINFPAQVFTGAYNQTTYGGGYNDAFILKFNSNCARIWATYYGGSEEEIGNSICTDLSDYLYVTGRTNSHDFPKEILQGAYNQSTLGGGGSYYDVFILKFSSVSIGIKKESNKIPSNYSLCQNFPNPFNPVTNIKFEIPKSSFVKMIIYNTLGQELTMLVNEKVSAGSYDVEWDGTDYPSGVYFYRLITDEYVDVKKMLLIK